VLDFGVAMLRSVGAPFGGEAATATEPPSLTSPGSMPGTLAYMSPEQLRGELVDARTDLFSLGIVLYQMATGRSPFAAATAALVSSLILTATPRSPRTLRPGLPAELERIVMKCLTKDRELRYQSARELLADLRRLERDLATGAPELLRGGRIPRSRWRLAAVTAISVALAAFLWSRFRPRPYPPPRVVPITADAGLKLAPRLSPDGEAVAYSWSGPGDDNWDVYVKPIGPGTQPLRLTESPTADWAPTWSPDGRQIAFLREIGDRRPGDSWIRACELYTLPSLGGREKRLIPVLGPRTPPPYTMSWSPDGRFIALADTPPDGGPSRIVRVDLSTLEKTPLTSPPARSGGDNSPEISPDGRRLVFVRQGSATFGDNDLWVQPLPSGQAEPLTSGRYDFCCDVAWTADGDEVVFATGSRALPGRMFRVAVRDGQAVPVAGVGENASFPSVRAGRLAFSQHVRRTPIEIWRTPGRNSPPASRTPRRLVFSSSNDSQPRYSPDGRRVAFASERGGSVNIWASDAEGRHAVQLTTFASHSGSPQWSPDSRTIAFDSREGGDPDVYVVEADGGVPRRLTREPSEDTAPSFARDGRSIYFTSNRSGRLEVWRVPFQGGTAVQITRGGGSYGEEAWDGQSLYFFRGQAVWRVPVAGGAEVEVVQGPDNYWQWTVARGGIYFATLKLVLHLRVNEATVRYFDFATGRATPVFEQSGPVRPQYLSVSPDEKWIIRHQHSLPQSEMMLIEGFR
jgi:Tol biopolymer transport system component